MLKLVTSLYTLRNTPSGKPELYSLNIGPVLENPSVA